MVYSGIKSKMIFSIAFCALGLLSAVATLATPFFAVRWFPGLVAMRVVQVIATSY